jgi:sugar phosphate permease
MGKGFKGTGALVVAAVILAVLGIFISHYYGVWALIVPLATLAAIVVLHFWNKRPVKTPEDDQVRLNLDK